MGLTVTQLIDELETMKQGHITPEDFVEKHKNLRDQSTSSL